MKILLCTTLLSLLPIASQCTTTEPTSSTTLSPEEIKAQIEKQIDTILATYPTVYTVSSSSQGIAELSVTNPDTKQSVADVKSLMIHKNFDPIKSFTSTTFDQTRTVQVVTADNKKTTGFIETVNLLKPDKWNITILLTTATHPNAPSTPQPIKPVLPSTTNQVTLALTLKSPETIRAELRTQLTGAESPTNSSNTTAPTTLSPEEIKAQIEKQIETILATYPPVYKVLSATHKVAELSVTNPDTQTSLPDITSVIVHKNFDPVTSFASATFDQTRTVLVVTPGNTRTIGVIEKATLLRPNQWNITIRLTTATHPTVQLTSQSVTPIAPTTKNQLPLPLERKSLDTIRAELRTQLAGSESTAARRGQGAHSNDTPPAATTTKSATTPAPAAPPAAPVGPQTSIGTGQNEEQIDAEVAIYPTTYKLTKPRQGIAEFVVQNPDTKSSVADINSLIIHNQFDPITSFKQGSFNQNRIMQWTTKTSSTPVNGYAQSVTKLAANQWRITIIALTPTQSTAPGGVTPVPPSGNKRVVINTLQAKPITEIRAEIQQRLSSTQPQQGVIRGS
jgi:hypothetical protein